MLIQVTIIENGKHMVVEMDNLTTMVEDLHMEFNKTQAVTEQNDGERTDRQEELKKNIDLMADKVISSIDRNANNFMTKVRGCQFGSFNVQKVPLYYYNQHTSSLSMHTTIHNFYSLYNIAGMSGSVPHI